jgi:predicted MPP superfamily phosphohydrolase
MCAFYNIKPGFYYVEQETVYLQNINKIVLTGDIGCTGFFEESKKILGKILELKPDVFFFLGDLICSGVEFEFREIIDFCNTRVQVPIFALRGNHDIRHYQEFLGLLSYTIVLDKFACIFLDNPMGYFLDEDIDFLARVLNNNKNRSVLIFMHIPPPTDIYNAHLPESEWVKIKTILDQHKERIKHIFCAHIHGYHEYFIDGYPVTITAGGGAAMVHDLKQQDQKFYHAVIINLREDGSLNKEVVTNGILNSLPED